MRVRFSPAAAQDLEDIGDYIAGDNPHAAVRFVDAWEARCMAIGDAPLSGVPRPELRPGLRLVPFESYLIFYTVDQIIRIERVLHAARDQRHLFAKKP